MSMKPNGSTGFATPTSISESDWKFDPENVVVIKRHKALRKRSWPGKRQRIGVRGFGCLAYYFCGLWNRSSVSSGVRESTLMALITKWQKGFKNHPFRSFELSRLGSGSLKSPPL